MRGNSRKEEKAMMTWTKFWQLVKPGVGVMKRNLLDVAVGVFVVFFVLGWLLVVVALLVNPYFRR